MGLDANGTKFLLYARSLGVSFARTAMIGRQGMHLKPPALKKNLSAFGHSVDDAEAHRLVHGAGGFAERFLEKLGAGEICSIDAAGHEQASVLHDLNHPIPESLKNRFTVVLDGGTLEPIFNFPIAIANCMEMLEVGGHFLGITPTNHFMGHGFYQFSPELFFRVFCGSNGFEIPRVILFEDVVDADWYAVMDPNVALDRVTLINHQPAYLLVMAKRTAPARIFAAPPQQSDYVTLWASGGRPPCAPGDVRRTGLLERLPGGATLRRLLGRGRRALAHVVERRLRRRFVPDPRFFKRIELR